MKCTNSIVSASIAAILCAASAAHAQQAPAASDQAKKPATKEVNVTKPQPAPAASTEQLNLVVVTGSRIRQTTDTATPHPVDQINPELISAQGFNSAGQALAEMPSMSPPELPNGADGVSTSLTGQAVIGAQYPNLFDLGAGRTLTLENGHRMVSMTGGLGDEAVDANIVPLGLLDRVDIIQGGGSVVYGSGAIAGAVNYVLKDHFQGVVVDAQASDSSRNDYPTGNLRITAGTDIIDHKGNIAVDVEWSKSAALLKWQRAATNDGPFGEPNDTPGAGTDGIPATFYVENQFNPQLSQTGAVIGNDSAFGNASLLYINGSPVRFSPSGTTLVPFNPGTPFSYEPPISNYGGDYNYKLDDGGAGASVPAVDRHIVNVLGHYFITDDVKLSVQLTYARIEGSLPGNQDFLTSFVNYLASIPGLAPLTFTKNNAYLTGSEIAELSAADPAFATGGSLVNGKGTWNTLYGPGGDGFTNGTDTYQGLMELDGDFNFAQRDFYWSASYSYGQSQSFVQAYSPYYQHLVNAIDAVQEPDGQIVCAANANGADGAPGCVPIDMFGNGQVSAAARQYVLVPSGSGVFGTNSPSVDTQQDVLLTLGGPVVQLPGGPLQFSQSYEHRLESESYDPLEADQLGLVFTMQPVLPASGSYHTDELATELDVPVFGNDFTLPGVKALDINGAYRFVDHSIAGRANVFGEGLKWTVIRGVTLRGSYTENFRAPNLSQLLLPASVGNGSILGPCAPTEITQGPNPSVRAANCLALFEANPTYGTGTSNYGPTQTTPLGAPAAERLANFLPNTFGNDVISTTSNPSLANEYSYTTTYGFVLDPAFIPNLTVSLDRILLNLHDAIISYDATQLADACFDSSPQPSSICNTLKYDSSGQIIAGTSTWLNAGALRLRADTLNLNYANFPLNKVLGGEYKGTFTFGLQGTRNEYEGTTIAGVTTRTDDTPALPGWAGLVMAAYNYHRLTVNYTVNYLGRVKLTYLSTQANSPDGLAYVASNVRHNISATYDFGNVQLRAGIENLTDKVPSFPTDYYGDLIGRQFFIGAKAKF